MSATDFVKGFITGQLALLGLLLVILRFLFFKGLSGFNGNRSVANGQVLIDSRLIASMKRKQKVSKGVISADTELMKAMFGDLMAASDCLDIHSACETAQWLNFFLCKFIVEPVRTFLLAEDPECLKLRLSSLINEWIFSNRNFVAVTRFVSAISVKNINISPSSRPELRNFHVVSPGISGNESAALRFCLEWTQIGSLELDSALQYANFENSAAPLVALPLSMSLSVKTIRATVQVQFSPDDAKVHISCIPDEMLSIELEVGSLIGHRSKLKDLPRITIAVRDVIKKVLLERIIHPRTLSVSINK